MTGQAGAVDLGHQEPGQGGEDKVEKVLANVDHNVVVSEDALNKKRVFLGCCLFTIFS